jgi:YD repeat-containing protein
MGLIAKAQDPTSNFDYTRPPIVIPPSPDVASLMKFTDVPVSYYTGTPQISFPLYTLKSNCASVNIGLGYNASGIKVEEEASWIGLGWNLMAGGAISRSVVGKPDENTPGYRYDAKALKLPLYTAATPYDWLNTLSTCDMLNMSNGTRDVSPDIYYLNFNGYSAKMYFDQNGTPLLTPYKAWKVEGSEATGFAITVEDGTRYEFNLIEKTTADVSSNRGDGSIMNYNSSWFLTQIKSPNAADIITFNYTPVTLTENARTEETWSDLLPSYVIPLCAGNTVTQTDRVYNTIGTTRQSFVLSSIESAAEKVITVAQNGRQDFSSLMLGEIQVWDKINNNMVKDFWLDHDYFGNAESSSALDKRLMLTDYKETSALGTLTTSFSYINPQSVPSKNSKAQDNWGYYNGAGNGSSLIPAQYDNNGVPLLSGADRSSKPDVPATGLLNQITYPTGGKVNFNYETNDYSFIKGAFVNQNHQLDSTFALTTVTASTAQLTTASGTITTTISIPANTQPPTVQYYLSGKYPTDPLADVFITENGNGIFSAGSSNGVWTNMTSAVLKPGHTYVLSVDRQQATETAAIRVTYYKNTAIPRPAIQSTLAGGVRIKSIIESGNPDPSKNMIRQFKYTLRDSVSSGVIMNLPIYEDITYTPVICAPPSPSNGSPAKVDDAPYFNRHSTSMNALGSTQGSVVGYSKVTVLYGANGENGSEEFDYTTTPYDDGGSGYPYIPLTSYDDLRGLLLQHIVYDQNGVALKKTINSYSMHSSSGDPNLKWVFGAKYGALRRSNTYDANSCPTPNFGWQFSGGMYKMYQFWPVVASTTESVFDRANNIYQTNTSNMAYNPIDLLLSREARQKSNGDSLITTYAYPQDYAGQAVYDAMLSQHVINKLVKRTVYTNSTQSFFERNDYNQWSSNVFAPQSISVKNATNPEEVRYTFYGFDIMGNLLEASRPNETHTTYLWGYNYQYPIAEVTNASYQNIVSILGQSAIDQLNTSPGPDAQIRSQLAVLRTSLPNSQVVINTYKPLVGKTSVTDAKGMTTYYEYDSFQRLMNIKDKDGNIVKHYCYNYAGQTSGCNILAPVQVYQSVDASKSFMASPLDGYQSISVTYPMPAGKYTSTVSQADADQKAIDDVNANGQAYADAHGHLRIYRSALKADSIMAVCNVGYQASKIFFSVPEGKFTSVTSQQDADGQANDYFTTQGQQQANSTACAKIYTSAAISQPFTKNDCPGRPGMGTSVTYKVAANAYNSIVSQADADNKAQNDVNANGQNYANANGSCIPYISGSANSNGTDSVPFTVNNSSPGDVITWSLSSSIMKIASGQGALTVYVNQSGLTGTLPYSYTITVSLRSTNGQVRTATFITSVTPCKNCGL